ncbi:hypothetical protein U6X42_12350, partial [Cutibacterium acnes]
DDLGVIPAIRSYIRWMQQRSGKEISFRAELPARRWEAEVEATLFRFCQEAVAYSLNDPESRRVDVDLSENRGVVLFVKDNRIREEHSLILSEELLEIKERVEALGGSLHLTSVHGGGTCMRAWIPHGPNAARVKP